MNVMDNLIPITIIGGGASARETLDVIDAINAVRPTYNMLGYIVDKDFGVAGTLVNEKPILGDLDWFLSCPYSNIETVVAVGAPELRLKLIECIPNPNIKFATLIHPSVRLTKWVNIGVGVVITAGCILTNQINIGNHVQINIACTISHDAVIEDFVTLSPGVHLAGNVKLGEGSFVGIGVNIIEQCLIGSWSIIGAGSTIIHDVPANTTVVGVPGQVIKKRQNGWQHQL